MILKREFYEKDTLAVAREILGKFLVHETKEGITIGKIVETEAYMGPEDKASHSFNGRRTKRTEVQFGPKGHSYVYQIYGMHFCFNMTSGTVFGKPEVVLVRALEPIEGIEIMIKRRDIEDQTENLANGPGKLCAAMGISKEQNGIDLCGSPLHVEKGERIGENNICQTKRINVDYAGKWKEEPWRFYVKNNDFVSVKTFQI